MRAETNGVPGDLLTARLRLVAVTPELARLGIEDRAELGRRLGVRVPEVWPGAAFAGMLPRLAGGFETRTDGMPPLPTRLVVYRDDAILVGETGFHGPPDRYGTVEVGYSVIPAYRGAGIALEATRALLDDAATRGGVRRVVAECLEENVASLRVLEKLGMQRVSRTSERLRLELRGDLSRARCRS